ARGTPPRRPASLLPRCPPHATGRRLACSLWRWGPNAALRAASWARRTRRGTGSRPGPSADPHGPLSPPEGGRRALASARCAACQDRFQGLAVVHELAVAPLERAQHLVHGLGRQALERPVPFTLQLGLDVLDAPPGRDVSDRHEVLDPGRGVLEAQ